MTVDWITLQKTAHDEFARRVEAVADWDAPTPDTEWKVRDLVRHVTREQQWVPLLLEGGDPAEAETRSSRSATTSSRPGTGGRVRPPPPGARPTPTPRCG